MSSRLDSSCSSSRNLRSRIMLLPNTGVVPAAPGLSSVWGKGKVWPLPGGPPMADSDYGIIPYQPPGRVQAVKEFFARFLRRPTRGPEGGSWSSGEGGWREKFHEAGPAGPASCFLQPAVSSGAVVVDVL